jgi:protein-S-isoprenylcysteine O-methyltransferase Ste14
MSERLEQNMDNEVNMSLGELVRENRIMASRLYALAMAVLFIFSESGWDHSEGIFSGLMFLTGVILIGIATVGRIWCLVYISGHKDLDVVDVGPYSLSRNPLYFFSLLGAIGVGLVSEIFTFAVLIGVAFWAYYPKTIEREEEKLRRQHGKAFDDYLKRVPRFFPRLGLPVEPDTYVIRPHNLGKGLLDSLWFVWIIGVVELLETLHRAGIVPVLLRLY